MTISDFESAAAVLVHQKLKQEIVDNRDLIAALTEAQRNNAVFVANKGNLGDGLIQLGTYTLFEELGWRPEVRTGFSSHNYDGCDWIVVGGGGAWVEGYLEEQARCAREFLERGGQMLLLPSSILGYEEYFRRYAGSVQIFVREKFSYDRLRVLPELAGRVHLCHDLAFAIDPEEFSHLRKSVKTGSINLFREDAESADLNRPIDNFDLALVANNGLWGSKDECRSPIQAAAGLLAQFRTVRTDRLHMTVLSAMLGCDVEMHSNSYFKNAGVFDFSIRQFPNVKFIGSNINDHSGPAAVTSTERSKSTNSRSEILDSQLLALSRLRREYFEPEILRLQTYASSLESRLREREQVTETERRRTEDLEARLREEERIHETERQRTRDLETRLAFNEERLFDLTNHIVPNLEIENRKLKSSQEEELQRVSQHFEPEVKRLLGLAEDQASELDRISKVNEQQAFELGLAKRQAERSQAELTKHFSSIQEERARTIFYTSEIDRLSSKSELLLKRISEFESIKEQWFEPEISRLNAQISEFENIRTSWFEPEIERLNSLLAEYEVVKSEWFEPQIRNYQEALSRYESEQMTSSADRGGWTVFQFFRRVFGL